MPESLVLLVHTLDGQSYNVRLYTQGGSGEALMRTLPTQVANGVWADERTFIPGTAIMRVEIVAGLRAEFPRPV
jgi:hypothetical protein